MIYQVKDSTGAVVATITTPDNDAITHAEPGYVVEKVEDGAGGGPGEES